MSSVEDGGEASGSSSESDASTTTSPYELGAVHGNTLPYATFETKPPAWLGTRWDSGAGYERWRSREWRPETSKKSKESVYVPIHRLLAVITCYPMEMDLGDILEHMKGRDVHHDCPEVHRSWGVPWDNRHDVLSVIGHGEHSEITNADKRAWAEDAKNEIKESQQATFATGGGTSTGAATECAACGASGRETTLATSEAFEGVRCLACAKEGIDGENATINVEGD